MSINVKKYLAKFESTSAYNTFVASNDYVTPNVSLITENNANAVMYNPYVPPHDYSQDYLTFVAEEDGTFSFNKKGTGDDIQYSVDDGETWTTLTSNTNTSTVQAGKMIMWKAELTPDFGIGQFSSTGEFAAQGNPMSLLYGDNFKNQKDLTGKDYAFTNLFYLCTGLTNAENISLVAMTLSNRCYLSMFCSCTSLITAPELPATSLTISCYNMMFSNCTSLTTAPELLGETLVDSCYNGMFWGCTNLNSITCLATDISASDCTNNWVYDVAASGTFTKAASMTDWTTGNNGIPSNWTVQDYIAS